ncbi:MAG TPA: urea ABC transporter ATP-binding subunit UrtE [Verrucomicrobiales bacterium]|nr:urea ABC transporter ATP-binding subunit UrtE [Verrucomicrobiales bacterium]
MRNLLELKKVEATYDQSVILRGVDLEVPPNSVVALLGRNGVGKTTTLRTIMGLVNTTAGTIELEGKKLGRTKPESRARMGVGYVPQGRDIFPMLTVWENLKVSLSIYGKESANRLEEVYTLFPVLKEMLHRKGGVLSGGQQQQLAIGRALLTRPKILVLDEPTEGIQPSIIDQIEDAILYLKKTYDMSILLVEQYLDFAKVVSDRFYIMDRGAMLTEGSIEELSEDLISRHLTV